ncbi:peptidoglycan-binding protein [Lampropedia cohaerens]|uniref:Peptidoglycan-associated lipoprotein n=1 Tax=Lampropedia cohaerens TaxID=1610491 RepID=A0A0U1PZU7_9BURK|nr:peptidoglycan-associated lipoprotein Pal [Lampropedia cohaerens]KKW68007.1 peptidoglycan-binding protein [Lampropedia cohaerens]
MLRMKKTLSYTLLVSALVLAGCSSTKLDDQAGADTGVIPTSPQDGSQTGISGIDLTASSIPGEGPANVSHIVYFDFDSYVVKPEYQSTLQSHADFLRNHTDYTVVLEGHTDDLGGREYNLALGQRRAEAVRQTLDLLGVPASRIEAVSYGMERPRVSGSTEEARAQNRRVEIRYNR